MRSVSFYIFRAFDTVWHEALIGKLESIGVGGTLLGWKSDFMHCHRQRLLLDGVLFIYRPGVPQDSVLRPILFLV